MLANPMNAAAPFQPPPNAAGVTAQPTTASSSSPTSTATITANDFLQLLVTELQNQDPTANTDPNQYVDQLVQVNSLQQQIQMNQTLDGGPTLTGSTSGVLQQLTQMNQTLDGAVSASSSSGSSGNVTSNAHALHGSGNLSSISAGTTQAAATVASALAPASRAANAPSSAFDQFAARLKDGAREKHGVQPQL